MSKHEAAAIVSLLLSIPIVQLANGDRSKQKWLQRGRGVVARGMMVDCKYYSPAFCEEWDTDLCEMR